MKEYPIIFSGDHPRKILYKLKTQTRRVMKPQPKDCTVEVVISMNPQSWISRWPVDMRALYPNSKPTTMIGDIHKCPYGQVGDRLWVRETWVTGFLDDKKSPSQLDRDNTPIWYKADFSNESAIREKWRPSIFMPRWASRITLEITEVRVERLNSMTDDDAHLEGVDNLVTFMLLWDRLNKKRGYEWKSNCWVWVITFKLCQ